MPVLPQLAEELFRERIEKITGNHSLLADRGWLVLTSTYPYLRIAVRHSRTGKLRVFEFQFDCWNDQPPALQFVDAETLETLPGCKWPRDNSGRWHATGWISAAGIETTKPFVCMIGIREYHTHKSHLNDLWANYRDLPDYSLENVVLQVAEAFQRADV